MHFLRYLLKVDILCFYLVSQILNKEQNKGKNKLTHKWNKAISPLSSSSPGCVRYFLLVGKNLISEWF